jgi:hypothetical protein
MPQAGFKPMVLRPSDHGLRLRPRGHWDRLLRDFEPYWIFMSNCFYYFRPFPAFLTANLLLYSCNQWMVPLYWNTVVFLVFAVTGENRLGSHSPLLLTERASRVVRVLHDLNTVFYKGYIRRSGPASRPPRGPELILLGFSCGYMKNIVHA